MTTTAMGPGHLQGRDDDDARPMTRAGLGTATSVGSALVFGSGESEAGDDTPYSSGATAGYPYLHQNLSQRGKSRRGTTSGMSDLPEEDEGEYYESEEEDVFAFLPPRTADMQNATPATSQSQQPIQHGLPSLPMMTPEPTSSTTFFFSPPPLTDTKSAAGPAVPMFIPNPPPSSFLPVESPPQTDSTTSSHLHNNNSMSANNFRMRPMSLTVPVNSSKKSADMERDIYTATSGVPYTGTGDGMSLTGTGMSTTDAGDGVGSIKMEFDFDNLGIGGDEDEDSPYPEVRASVSNIDDPEMPALTFRMWTIGLFLNLIMGAINIFFNFRNPAPTLPPLVSLLLAYPLGKLFAYSLPINTYKVPEVKVDNIPVIGRWSRARGKVLGGWEWSLNPGPWNIKEHVLCCIMANVAINPPYAMSMIVVSEIDYNQHRGFGFNLMLVFATQLTGFGLAGLCRRFLVWPASMVWPQNLVTCTLLNTLHAEDDAIVAGLTGMSYTPRVGHRKGLLGLWDRLSNAFATTQMSRYRFFTIVGIAAFIWMFIPGFLWVGLSIFGWACWIAPNNVVVNQLFGVSTGLGMGLVTFDWTQISWIGSPLAVPWWAQCHVFIGFVLVYWILAPVMYYTNVWDLSYFTLSSLSPYDKFGKIYNVSRILTPQVTFNQTAYDEYSPLYLPTTYAMTYLLAFALSTCVLVHTLLYHGKSLLKGVKKIRVEPDDIHAKLMRNYPEVPDWWYGIVFVFFFSIAIIVVEAWHTGIPVYMLVLSVMLPVIYVLPSGFIFAMTAQSINLNLIAQIIPGSLLPGDPLVNMLFKSYSIQTLGEALSFTQDLKLGHYIKVAPRATFLVQLVSTVLAAVVQISVKTWMFANIQDICQDDQRSHLTCPHNRVFFTASAIWGLVGPSRQFGASSIYHPQLYALLIGVFLPFPFWLWQRKYKNTRLKFVNIPVLINGIGSIPPATGINYSSWFATGFVFQYLIRRKNFAWWSKFNYITSAALDCGSLLSVLFVFFVLTWPFAKDLQPVWWGNTVFENTADFNGTPFRQIPPGGIPGR